MTASPHIMIIGAGLIGLSTADSLAAKGARVTVIDRRTGPALGASFANSGMVHPSQAMPWTTADIDPKAIQDVIALGERSRGLIKARIAELGLMDVHREPGVLKIYETEEVGLQAAKTYRELGIPAEIKQADPWAFGRYAIFFPDDISGNAFSYCQALARDLVSKGVKFIYGATHIDFARIETGLTLGDVFFEADHIVIAAGTGSQAIADLLGIDLDIKPERGHSLNFDLPNVPLPSCPVLHDGSHSALTIYADHLRLSGTLGEDDPDVLLDIWKEIAPDIIGALGPPTSRWSEDRPATLRGYPYIGPTHVPGVWLNTGHAHMGWTLSAGSGERLAQMILG